MSYSMSIRSRAANTKSRRRRRPRSHQHAALHMRRNLDAGEGEHRRRQVDEAHELVADGAGREGRRQRPRPADHQRHAQAGIVERPLGARHAVAVIAPVEDDGVLREPVVLELGEDLAHLRVHVGDVVVQARQLLADQRRVGVVRRDLDRGRVGDERLALARRAGRKDAALVRDLEVEDREERLAPVGPVAPVRILPEVVPDRERARRTGSRS